MNKTVTIATLVRDRAFILPCFLDYLLQLHYDKKLIHLLWIVNNSTDNSKQILEQFKEKHVHEYHCITIEEINKPYIPKDSRNSYIRNNFTYTHLANLRNYVLSKIKTDILFFIDSDILLIDSETLNKLLGHNVDIVGSIIYNGYEFDSAAPHHYTNAMIKDKGIFKHLSLIHIREIQRKGKSLLQPVDLTGAIYCISKKVIDNKSILYAYHINGEDTPFCEAAKKHGFDIYVDLGCYNQHIMNEKCFELFLRGKLNDEKNFVL